MDEVVDIDCGGGGVYGRVVGDVTYFLKWGVLYPLATMYHGFHSCQAVTYFYKPLKTSYQLEEGIIIGCSISFIMSFLFTT